MNNAELFKRVFGISATEFWTYTETEMLNWLSTDVPDTNVEDMISRQVAITALRHVDEYNGRSIETIRNMPSAEPRWIPVTERLPECGIDVLTDNGYGEYEINHTIGGGWYWELVAAWMPLPKPYKGGNESDKD